MEKTKKSGLGTASLVLGIIGTVLSFIPILNYISFILGILAFVFAIVCLCKKASKGFAIAGLVLSIIALFMAYTMHGALSTAVNEVSSELDKVAGNSTQEVLQNDFDIQYGEYQVQKDKYSSTGKLIVTVKNKTNKLKSGSIQFEAVNSEGNRMANDYIYINSLGAEQSQEFEIFNEYITEDINKMKQATFKIVEASVY